tara:strand:+ start:843 stop:1049 length:207 start_codon:yes stop_codon:yes gene_type:complete
MNIPFFRNERRISTESKMDIAARMQNIIKESAVVVKFMVLENFELMIRRLKEKSQYQELSFIASFYIV